MRGRGINGGRGSALRAAIFSAAPADAVTSDS